MTFPPKPCSYDGCKGWSFTYSSYCRYHQRIHQQEQARLAQAYKR